MLADRFVVAAAARRVLVPAVRLHVLRLEERPPFLDQVVGDFLQYVIEGK